MASWAAGSQTYDGANELTTVTSMPARFPVEGAIDHRVHLATVAEVACYVLA